MSRATADEHVEAIRARTRLGMPPCPHRHPGGEEECTACLLKWGDARTMDVAHLLRVIDELTKRTATPAP
jgi:hypothetical protein